MGVERGRSVGEELGVEKVVVAGGIVRAVEVSGGATGAGPCVCRRAGGR